MTEAADSPARGTRPRNRRAITLGVATEMFYRLGYATVAMSDIATATDLSTHLRAARTELDESSADVLAWCTLGALVSVGFHSLTLPRPEFVDLLVDIVRTITALPMPGDEPSLIPPEVRKATLVKPAPKKK